ncbi:MAG: acetate--CoA ligase family protein [Alphaproteobacteria bacterium]
MPDTRAVPGWLDALFTPRGVALIGASETAAKPAARPLRYLRREGWRGGIYPINPNRQTIDGHPVYPDLAAVPGPVDHAYVLVNTDAAIEAVRACGAAGVRIATILAGGFSEDGPEGAGRQSALLAAARAHGVRLIGPNCLGIVDTHSGFLLTGNAAFEAKDILRGNLTILSQSGTVIGTLLSRGHARGVGFSKLVSVGNEADLGIAEIGAALVDDPRSDAFLLFLETIRDPAAMEAFFRAADAAGKPVIAYKLGRSQAAQEVAVSHTGALVGSDAAVDSFLRDCGVIRVDQLESLFEIAPLALAHRPPQRPGKGGSVAVVTTTGGGAAMVVDRLGINQVEAIAPQPETIERLRAAKVMAEPRRILDLTLAGTRPDIMGAAIDTLMAAPEFDAVIAVVGSSAQFYPDHAVAPLVARGGGPKPLAVFIVPEAPESLRLLRQAGIAAFRTPEACGDAVSAWLAWRHPRVRPAPGDLTAATAALGRSAGGVLNEREALEVLTALGIPFAPTAVLDGDGDPGIGWPVAAKVLSRDVPHKTEAGGVVLDIGDRPALREAAARIRGAVAAFDPAARIDGILVQRMAAGGIGEALVGYRVDSQVGPIVTVGAGGTMAEIYRDIAMRPAPVDLATAAAMIDEVRGFAALRGFRGKPAGDLDALARAVADLSRLAGLPAVREAEINPLIVRAEGQGVVAVDALVRTST